MEPQGVAERMESYSQPVNSEDLLVLEGQKQEENVPKEVFIIKPKGLTSKILPEVFRYFEAGMVVLEKHDLDFETSLKVNPDLARDYASYKEI